MRNMLCFIGLLMSLCILYVDAGPILNCAPCTDVICQHEPTNCETDIIPCGCCRICARREGEICEAFAPRCGTGLVCLTPAGIFKGRPEWYQPYFKGICVKDSNFQN